jgi:outer membrane receptor protein involved in Fe transport
LTVSGEYSREKGVKSYYDRDWYQSGSLITNPAVAADPTARPIYVPAYNVVGTNFTCGGMVISPNAAINGLEFLPDGSYAPFVKSNLSASGPGTNNAQSLQNSGGSGCDPKRLTPLSADHEKGLAFASAVYDVSDDVSINLQGLFAHDWANFGPSQATMAPTRDATIYSGNPFLPAGLQALMTANKISSFKLSRDNSDLFPANTNKTYVRNRTFMVTGGLDATLNTGGLLDQWKGTAYLQYGQNQQRASFFGKVRADTLYTALDAVRDPASGNSVCRAALINPARYSDCVPLNLFGEGQASDSAIRYVTTPLKGEAGAVIFHYLTKETDAEASLSGEVFDGIGAGPVSAAIGASYRKQSVSSSQSGLSVDTGGVPLNETQVGGTPGVRGIPGSIAGDPDSQLFDSYADVEGSQTVKEVFGELDVPLLMDKPLAQKLSLNLAARYADYSGSGGIWAYKAGLDWALSDGIRLRGTYSRDVRAASLSEAFDAQRTNGTVNNDPVTGLTYNFSQTTGGNPNVAPEKADTITAGLVLQPAFLPGFGLSVDYYNIRINDAINQLGTQRIVDQCASGSTELCALITRDPTSGVITDLRNVFINIAEEKASGLDIEADYRSPISLFGGEEKLALRGLASILIERTLSIPGSGVAVLDGQLATLSAGDDFAYPHLQMTGNVSYTNGPVTFTVTERYIGGGKLDNTYVEGVDVANNHVQPVWYTDFGITYALVDEGPHKVDVYGFVTNLFDAKPPFAPEPWSTLNGSFQTNRQLYDFLGQRFLVGARFSF